MVTGNRVIFEDNKAEATFKTFDHGAYEVTFKDDSKSNFIARNIYHLIYCFSKDNHLFSKEIVSIKELAMCSTVFTLQNKDAVEDRLNVAKGRAK